MKILLACEKEFLKELGVVRHNLKKHTGIFQTTDVGKFPKGVNVDKIILDKDILLLKEVDSLLVCNFKREENIDSYSLILMSIAYSIGKKIYLLYDVPYKYIEKIKCLEITSLNGDLKKIM